MKFSDVSFGTITIDGKRYNHDLVLDRGEVRKRKKKASKAMKSGYGHTPLTAAENIPWDCETLYVGTGMYGSLPVHDSLKEEAVRRSVRLVCATTPEIVKMLEKEPPTGANAILHITC